MAKQENHDKNIANEEATSTVFDQIIKDEEFSGLISKFKEDEQRIVLKTIQDMVSTIEKTLVQELSQNLVQQTAISWFYI